MAPPKKTGNGHRPNRIRFVMLDADISDGNLSELTQAISTALKPPSFVRQLPSNPPALPNLAAVAESATAVEEVPDAETPGAELEESAGDENARTSRTRPKFPLPKYLPDLDIKGGGTPFKEYAEENDPKKQVKRYLLAAKWLRDHGNSSTINTDKVYTLFRTAGWPLGIKDWDGPFREAVRRDLVHRTGTGEYTITPVGEDLLRKSED